LPPIRPTAIGPLTFERLKWTSFSHSLIYLSLLLCAFALRKPEPETFVLGLTHGLLWIAMSLVCIFAARKRLVPLRVAAAAAVLGAIGPFFGSYEFAREQRRRDAASRAAETAQPASQSPSRPDAPR
jgi:hypothetical protein